MHQLFEEINRNLEILLSVGNGHQHRIVSGLARKDGLGGFQPLIQLLPLFPDVDSWIIGDVIGVAHEGVDRTKGVALVRRKHEKAVVEVFGRAPGNASADSIGMRELLVHRSLSAAAWTTSQSLRGLEMTGRRRRTSNPWFSMAFRISCPPRLKSSRSTASSRSTFLISGSPRLNHSRARRTWNFMSSRNCGVARCCAMSSSVTPKRRKSSSGR